MGKIYQDNDDGTETVLEGYTIIDFLQEYLGKDGAEIFNSTDLKDPFILQYFEWTKTNDFTRDGMIRLNNIVRNRKKAMGILKDRKSSSTELANWAFGVIYSQSMDLMMKQGLYKEEICERVCKEK